MVMYFGNYHCDVLFEGVTCMFLHTSQRFKQGGFYYFVHVVLHDFILLYGCC